MFGNWGRSGRKRCSGRPDESRGPIDRVSLSLNLILGRYFWSFGSGFIFYLFNGSFFSFFFSLHHSGNVIEVDKLLGVKD